MTLDILPWLPALPGRLRPELALVDAAGHSRGAGHSRAEGHSRVEGLLALRRLATHRLSLPQMAPVARLAERLIGDDDPAPVFRALRLGILSDTTSAFLPDAIRVAGLRHGLDIRVTPAPDDQIPATLNDPAAAFFRADPELVLLSLDRRRLPHWPGDGAPDTSDHALDRVLAHLEMLHDRAAATTGATIMVQTLPQMPAGLFGHFDRRMAVSARRRIDQVNQWLVDWAEANNAILFDLAALAETVGTANWHDPREWHWSKSAISTTMLPLYADHVARIAAARAGLARRCLVLDLDDTLWSGVIGDDGPEAVVLGQGDPVGEAFLSVQRMALDLRRRGVVLAVSSKNDEHVARGMFRDHPDMLLRESDIAVFVADWRDKATQIEDIAARLGWGVDALVLLDDNPAERRQVREALPQVAVPELPDDPAGVPDRLLAAGYFETTAVSDEDYGRAGHYTRLAQSRQAQSRHIGAGHVRLGGFQDYLRALDTRIDMAPVDAASRGRAAQLISRSNQFNLTTRRHDAAALSAMEAAGDTTAFCIRLRDTFGDAGIISVVICRAATGEGATLSWAIDTWLMSCRVLNRRVEAAVLAKLVDVARAKGIATLTGLYLPSGRNAMVAGHYAALGFTAAPHDAWPLTAGAPALPPEATVWQLRVADHVVPPDLPITINV
ncbi:HAD-IIIC family phosphatase (plasmid) [Tistrella bauzanensis]|uniref:HAD-IIIC family phosphatase n=1 Tax=Tistrella TaxID=171436 RepID=UPI0031F612F3